MLKRNFCNLNFSKPQKDGINSSTNLDPLFQKSASANPREHPNGVTTGDFRAESVQCVKICALLKSMKELSKP